jgi:hypothetical protein
MATEQDIYKIANRFELFLILKQHQIEGLKQSYPEKSKIRSFLSEIIRSSDPHYETITNELEFDTKLEILILLTELCIKNFFLDLEMCAVFSVVWKTLDLSFRQYNRKEIFEFFKNLLLKFSMNRPPYQISIFRKETLQIISDFYIENIYKRNELLRHLLSKKDNITIQNLDMNTTRLPHILDLNLGTEVTSKSIKILKAYTQSKKPKSDFDIKIEQILDFEREILDKILEKKFVEQDQVFNKKLDELISKKKK